MCGTDGKLYNNHCELHRTACKTGKKIRVDWDFKCFKKADNGKKGRQLHDNLRNWIDLRRLFFPLRKRSDSVLVERSLSTFRGWGGKGALKGILGRVVALTPSQHDPVYEKYCVLITLPCLRQYTLFNYPDSNRFTYRIKIFWNYHCGVRFLSYW